MTDKEFQRLNRRQILKIMLDRTKEAEALQEELNAAKVRYGELEIKYNKLCAKLDEKDAKIMELRANTQATVQNLEETIERLKERLNAKDAKIADLESAAETWELHVSEAGTLAEACMRLNKVFEAAQRAADQYLEGVKESYSKNPAPKAPTAPVSHPEAGAPVAPPKTPQRPPVPRPNVPRGPTPGYALAPAKKPVQTTPGAAAAAAVPPRPHVAPPPSSSGGGVPTTPTLNAARQFSVRGWKVDKK